MEAGCSIYGPTLNQILSSNWCYRKSLSRKFAAALRREREGQGWFRHAFSMRLGWNYPKGSELATVSCELPNALELALALAS